MKELPIEPIIEPTVESKTEEPTTEEPPKSDVPDQPVLQLNLTVTAAYDLLYNIALSKKKPTPITERVIKFLEAFVVESGYAREANSEAANSEEDTLQPDQPK